MILPETPANLSENEGVSDASAPAQTPGNPPPAPEIGGREGPEPTRFGDWEKNGRCIDF